MSQTKSEEAFNKVLDNLSEDFQNVKPLTDLSQKLNLKPGLIILTSFSVCVLFIVVGFCGKVLSSLIGMLYPGYMSFKAVETKEVDDDKQWLTYWIVFAFMQIFDGFFNTVFQFSPLYYPIKLILIVYLFYPKSKGALTFYNNFLKSLIQKYEDFIDRSLLFKGEDSQQ